MPVRLLSRVARVLTRGCARSQKFRAAIAAEKGILSLRMFVYPGTNITRGYIAAKDIRRCAPCSKGLAYQDPRAKRVRLHSSLLFVIELAFWMLLRERGELLLGRDTNLGAADEEFGQAGQQWERDHAATHLGVVERGKGTEAE